ncbi:amidohydrolase family protein [Tahibacter amnicola]|uniref:Amidohydrolase family protein n=1 Tax=Tahibacter amnicola TaxID=2976241 RepID=A0ABY6BFU1_9GAMM|nr:amidohydrolase family protein [Tahibacter amnicola]UXI68657.1 amidohydrolase family protein [Tahibacter amnicola]
MTHRPLALALGLILAVPALAADKEKKAPEWNVNAPHGATKSVKFTTDEGTWMDLDVCPDGRQIVFQLLGDLYLLPIEGGTAKRVTSGASWDVQPRFSPDGKEIAFTSDRAGGNNLWRIRTDGSNAKQVTKENFRLLNNPVWTPDGQYLIGRKHFSSERSLGAGELWLYHTAGGEGLQLTKKKNDQQDLGEPAVSPDGRYVYFSEDVSPGPSFQYNKNPHGTIYAIKRLDRQTGDIVDVVSSPGGAVRPQPSPDGKSLAFVKRVREKSVLHKVDLSTNEVTPLWDGLSHDMQEAWAIFGPYANFAWTPDSRSIVIWAQGKLWRVDAASGKPAAIPFSAAVDQTVAAPLRFEQPLDRDHFAPRMIRDVATSPDGRTVVFHALGHLWTKSLPDGKPQRLATRNDIFEYQPRFNADGSKLLYTTWSDEKQGAIVERDLRSGSERTLTSAPGFYYSPAFSPDGKYVVWSKQSGSSLTGSLNSGETGVYVMAIDSGKPVRVAKEGVETRFSGDSKRVIFLTGGDLKKKISSVGLNGEEPREIFDLKYVDSVSISPDGRWVAFTELFNAYVTPMPQTGGVIELNKDSSAIPVTKVSADVGSYLHWGGDSRSLHWMVGNRYFTRELKDAFAFVPGAPATLPKPESLKGIDLGLTTAVDKPTEVVAFTHARLVTMNGEEVIEDGTLVVEGDTIKALGRNIAVPSNARVVDASGKTIVPGYVDVHAHANHFSTGVVPQANWAYYSNLAFGITTMHDPSATTETVFSQAELVKSGDLVGPRVFSTGTILYGADGDFKAVVNSLDDARAHLRRMKANGAFSVKSYNQPRREQHQQINQAARELGMLVVEEGGSTFNHNLPMILDGATSIEHNIPVAPLYGDVVNLWKQTDVRNTPTLVVTYGGLSGEYWWYARSNIWEDKKLKRFFPRETLEERSVRRETAPEWDYHHIEVAKATKHLRDNGIRIQIGGHGQLQGLAPHWEIWMLTQGGFSNHEALRAATFDGADMLGMSKELGSLTPGKRADLVVLNTNPLENIQATVDTRYVMVNGRLFDVDADMAEVGGKQRPAPTFYWQRHRDGRTFGMEYGPTAPCHCPKGNRRHQH